MKRSLPGYTVFFLITILTCTGTSATAQRKFKLPDMREVVVIKGDSTIKANVKYHSDDHIHTLKGRMYHWYASNSIQKNIGDYEGKLLYGAYLVFDNDNRMVIKGNLSNGLKHGTWTEWYENGKVRSIKRYRFGRLHGRQKFYNKEGKLIEEVKYRRGEKKGVAKEFDGKKGYNKVKYVDLKEVSKDSEKKKRSSRSGKKDEDKKNKEAKNRKNKSGERDLSKDKKEGGWFNWLKKDPDKTREDKKPKKKKKDKKPKTEKEKRSSIK